MTPYWITVERVPYPTPINLGVGITARSEADAVALSEAAFGSMAVIDKIKPITDFRDIEQNHVAPNMGDWSKRGIWFPLGYDHISN
jgi:hypothetical protein